MASASAQVPTALASRYLQQLAKHWSHKLAVSYTPEVGTVDFPNGAHIEIRADSAKLEVTVTVPDGVDLARMCGVVAEHLDRFAFREAPLPFNWT